MAISKTLILFGLAFALLLLVSQASARELAQSETSGEVNVDHYHGKEKDHGYRNRNINGYGHEHKYHNRHRHGRGHYGKPGHGGHPGSADEAQVQN